MVATVASCLFSLVHTLAVHIDSLQPRTVKSIVLLFKGFQKRQSHIVTCVYFFTVQTMNILTVSILEVKWTAKVEKTGMQSRKYISKNQYRRSILPSSHSINPPHIPLSCEESQLFLYNIHFPTLQWLLCAENASM